MTTIKELIEALKKYPEDYLIAIDDPMGETGFHLWQWEDSDFVWILAGEEE